MITNIIVLNKTPKFLSVAQIQIYVFSCILDISIWLASRSLNLSFSKPNSWFSLTNMFLLQSLSFQEMATPSPPVAQVETLESTLLLQYPSL